MKLFGTDGVRGEAGTFLTPQLAYKLGLYAANRLKKEFPNKTVEILIATDTRISSDMLKASISSGIMAAGVNVIDAEVLPTPTVSFLVKENNYAAGVMISASHNVFTDNGIKFFNTNGYKLSDEIEKEIEEAIANEEEIITTGKDIGILKKLKNYDSYINLVKKEFHNEGVYGNNRKLKVVIDTANGAAYELARLIFSDDFDVFIVSNTPNGININENCGSTHMEALKHHVIKNDFDLGIALDGDGDRMLAIDSKGNIIQGDELMLIFASYLKERNALKNNTLVATIMSNSALSEMLSKDGIDVVKTKVGDRYVLEEMLKIGANLGGEDSGHIIFLDKATTGDGLLSAAILLKIVKEVAPLHILNKLVKYPQITLTKEADENKKKSFETEIIKEKIKSLKEKHSAVTVRASGTEPVIRITIEGKDIEEITKDAEALKELI